MSLAFNRAAAAFTLWGKKKRSTDVNYAKKHRVRYTQANETLHFMLHGTENGIWKEVDSASSQRTRSSLSIPPQELKKKEKEKKEKKYCIAASSSVK